MTTAESLITAYVAESRAENFGEGETAPPLYDAIADAVHPAETRALGLALCVRHDALCDTPYVIGAERCDPRIQAIADAIGYAA